MRSVYVVRERTAATVIYWSLVRYLFYQITGKTRWSDTRLPNVTSQERYDYEPDYRCTYVDHIDKRKRDEWLAHFERERKSAPRETKRKKSIKSTATTKSKQAICGIMKYYELNSHRKVISHTSNAKYDFDLPRVSRGLSSNKNIDFITETNGARLMKSNNSCTSSWLEWFLVCFAYQSEKYWLICHNYTYAYTFSLRPDLSLSHFFVSS